MSPLVMNTLNHFHFGLGALGFLYGDDAVLLYLCHSIGNELTDLGVIVGRYIINARANGPVTNKMAGICFY